MLWVLKRTVLMRRFFRAPKTDVKTDEKENIYNLTLKICVYLNLCLLTYLLTLLCYKETILQRNYRKMTSFYISFVKFYFKKIWEPHDGIITISVL